ncbi:MAG TPA: adenine phosphoribosyltransferase [Holophaga sp.]|jgi:adenine phosphoribosyltransferase|nr:adenine phosphoribosyltransferase [Holophaga sp.]
MEFRKFVRDVADFPFAGVCFRDVSPLLADAQAFAKAIEAMAAPVLTLQPTHVLGLESRGFIFGSALAQKLGLGFVPARRVGKLPPPTLCEDFTVCDVPKALEIQAGSFRAGDRVLIVDDVIGTGNTAAAAKRLIERTGAHPVALTLFLESAHLSGRDKLAGLPVFSVLRY